jgi:signal transduction histidine kinase
MIELALIVATAALAAGLAATILLRLLPTVSLQLAGLALLSATVPLAAVLLSGWVMFHMGADVKILTVTTAAAFASVGAALLLARSIARRIERLRADSIELAAGDLAETAPAEGPAELAQLAASFNEMASRLAALFDARRELIAWASHDLRTAIASMQAMLEALEDGLAEPDDSLPILQQQVRTLARLVDDLFELARIDAGALTLELREAQLAGSRRGVSARTRGGGESTPGQARGPRRRGCDRLVRPRSGSTRAPQPRHERTPPHALRRLDRCPRGAPSARSPGDRRGYRRGPGP